MSDFNSATASSSVMARRRPFRDLDLSLTLHPIKKDIIPLKDLDCVRMSVRNIVSTNFYERPFGGHFIGADLRSRLFELNDMFTYNTIRQNIEDAIAEYEPRVKISEVRIRDNSDRNSYEILIQFHMVSTGEEGEVSINLIRVR